VKVANGLELANDIIGVTHQVVGQAAWEVNGAML
jgi:hypothetical protein